MRMPRGRRCPIHGKYTCCGRDEESIRKEREVKYIEPGVRLMPNGTQRRSPAAMKRLLEQKVANQNGCCYWCGKAFTDMREIDPDHVEPCGMGGARRDDSPANIVASCRACNSEKGSRRDFEVKMTKPEKTQ